MRRRNRKSYFLKLKSQTENEISFSVCVSKGSIVQESNRTIFAEFVNECYYATTYPIALIVLVLLVQGLVGL